MFLLFTFILKKLILVQGILGGYDIEIVEAPYQVNYGDVCGGALLHKRWALSSAHCGKNYYIRVGSKYRLRGFRVEVVDHMIHPQYGDQHGFDYDVQLLKLRKNLQFSEKVAAIPISGWQCRGDVLVAGWGYSEERGEYNEFLQEVRLNIVPFSECQEVKREWYNHTLTSRMFCAGGGASDACQGDSGGPAVCLSRARGHGLLVGISSFGYGCGRRVPGVYVDVTHPAVRGWLRNLTGV